VREAVTAERIPPAWLAEVQAIVWFADMEGVRRLCVASANVADPAIQEAAEQWDTVEPLYYLAEAQALKPYFAELDAEARAVARLDAGRLREIASEGPVIAFVDAMLSEAHARRASDVHIEPFENGLSVRCRIDGVLTPWRTAPRSLFDAVSSRIKILSGMDIAERRLPQDGRQSLRLGREHVEARVSSLPTTWGESIVLRFLGRPSTLPTLSQLGLDAEQEATVREMAGATSGMLLVTGPTGSGKTTTIYRLITDANDGRHKIVSVEDPVEIDLPGVLQTAVRPEIGLSFAAGLRSILRQDPDIIMVGEIRDPETAAIAVQAALTGHLVISTLHTNSAIAAVSRLLDLGVEPYFIADVMRGLVGQRLVRRLCPHCSAPAGEADEEAFARDHVHPTRFSGPAAWRRAVGCERCGGTGFVGRTGIFETLPMSAALRQAIRQRRDESAMRETVFGASSRTLLEDGVLKARAGLTTLGEVQRVLGSASP
jgi:general secretion pathway protein E